MKKNGGERLEKPLFRPAHNPTLEQWRKLDLIREDLDTEYNLRRTMLLRRLDVTAESFKWSDHLLGKAEDITKMYLEKRTQLEKLQNGGGDTDIPALLAARQSLSVIEKTSSASVRKFTKSKIQRHLMGLVPDRGGRANEHTAPPPEMPPWAKRDGGRGGGRGGPRGGGRGGDLGGSQRVSNHKKNKQGVDLMRNRK